MEIKAGDLVQLTSRDESAHMGAAYFLKGENLIDSNRRRIKDLPLSTVLKVLDCKTESGHILVIPLGNRYDLETTIFKRISWVPKAYCRKLTQCKFTRRKNNGN